MKNNYSPDILNCLANLSSDEVFTSPELANRMLDLLPQELFRSPKTQFLDPCSKSGVFLREIAKRLLAGLEEQIPDLQERIDHVMTKQVFGITCTDLTAEMSRRTLYCSKLANGEYSVSTAFDDAQGNLLYERCHHTWNAQGRCEYCGASKGEYLRTDSRETYAYPFIHKSIKEIFHKDMQFDVIIGNPPYQMSDGGGTGSSAMPIYQLFVQQAKKVKPVFLVMIMPSRWMTGGKHLDEFRKEMLEDKHIQVLHDYINASDCFPQVQIEGGVCYFMRNAKQSGKCKVYLHQSDGNIVESERYLDEGGDIMIRDANVISILQKVQSFKESSFESIVSKRNPFNLVGNIEEFVTTKKTDRRILCRYESKRQIMYLKDEVKITRNLDVVPKYKLFVSKADGAAGQLGNPIPARIIGKAEMGEPNMICSETFLFVYTKDRSEAECVSEYMKTKFFRFMVGIRKNKNMTHDTYLYVPLQDFSHPWTDEMLYKKYGLTQDEIAFIESMIRPME
ncbi:MAG: Eco57I restriction-modification methylase domain-containing protein [Bacteroidales bacterium]|nr:Eco57I restriction-modification methylase domain-containing protein [Bacteroidales bacterium]